jgi:Ca2+:H+ antiporter
MKKASPDSESFLDRIRSWARTKAHGPSPLTAGSRRPSTLPLSNSTRSSTLQKSVTSDSSNNGTVQPPPFPSTTSNSLTPESSNPTANNVADNTSVDSPPPAPPPQDEGQGSVIDLEAPRKNVAIRFYETGRDIVFSSWINVLLVFVPVGVAVNFVHSINPTIIFVMNAIAIIPLAGLLSHATESVAKRMGDTIGALMNITFGNAVEIIILLVFKPPVDFAANNLTACMSTSTEIKTRKSEKPS